MDFNGIQIEEISSVGPEQEEVRCIDSSVCSANQYCSNGYCKDEDPSQKPGPSVGECEESLPDPEEDSDCDNMPEVGGCDEAGCGERVGEEPTPCEEKEEEEEEEDEDDDSFKKCSPFADEYFKSYGKYPTGYGPGYVCGECEDCEYTNDYFCEPHDSFTFDVDCNCLEKDYCLNKYGPCYKCGGDGECYFECDGCQVECMEYFECPCDKSKKKFKATGYYSPCRPTTAYGPGGTCWSSVADKVKAFCTETFGDDCDSCVDDCEGATQQGTYEYNCAGTPPEKTCTPNGYMEVPDQPTVAFATICTKNPDCRCDGDPSSSNYRPCGLCEVCDGNGDCVTDPECNGYFGEGQRASSRYWEMRATTVLEDNPALGSDIHRNYYTNQSLVRYTGDAYFVQCEFSMSASIEVTEGVKSLSFRFPEPDVVRGFLIWDADAYIFRRIKSGGPGSGTPMYRRNAANFSGQQYLYRVRVRITEPILGPGSMKVYDTSPGTASYRQVRRAREHAGQYFNGFLIYPRKYPCPGYFEQDISEIGTEYNEGAEQGGANIPEEYRGFRYPVGTWGRNWTGIGPDGKPSSHPQQNAPDWW